MVRLWRCITVILGTTGHRLDKLAGKIEAVHLVAATRLHELKPRKVYTGMAIGWDQIVAAKCIGLGIPFGAIIPFDGQELTWPAHAQAEYRRLLSYATDVIYVSRGGYSFRKMHERNRWIVDHSSKLLACWDGTAGGTANTVLYALKRGWTFDNEIVRIDPSKL